MSSPFPRILLLTPPLTQLNTPYPATAYIKGFLGGRGYAVTQADMGLQLVLRLLSVEGLKRVFAGIEAGDFDLSDNAKRMVRLQNRYLATITPVIRFLQNKDLTLAPRICHGRFLPEASRFDNVADLETAFGTMGLTDQARHLATLYLEDLADLIKETVGPQFGFSRYAEKLALSATSFEPLHDALQAAPNLLDQMLLEELEPLLARVQPDVVGFTVPFPGNLYGALRLAKRIKEISPTTATIMGGGYPNTELRTIQEPRFFDYIDYLTLDDGEGPWLRLLEYLSKKKERHAELVEASLPLRHAPLSAGEGPGVRFNEAVEMLRQAQHDVQDSNGHALDTNEAEDEVHCALQGILYSQPDNSFLQRTFLRNAQGQIEYINYPHPDVPHHEVGTPDYSDLPLTEYLSVLEVLNPMHRLWSDGRWNKLTVAHGCYWKRCSFCDVTLDYISRYETAPSTLLVDRIEQIIQQTGQTGFHFVDEAAPPLALRDLAVELLKRRVPITWWGNIRFEKTFSPDLCRLLAASGCIAISGGLEVASDRLLALMEKGVTIAQVARVADGFTQAGIMVHAYLMYGFPTQTAQETVDSLEVVRQLFAAGVVQSGYWHRFSMTAHSPVGKNPAKYQVAAIGPEPAGFAWNDLWHDDPLGTDHEAFGPGLAKSLYNYLHGVALDESLSFWFDFKTPRPTTPRHLIQQALQAPEKPDFARQNQRLFWFGNAPEIRVDQGKKAPRAVLTCYEQAEDFEVKTSEAAGRWLHQLLTQLSHDYDTKVLLKEAAATFPASEGTFETFLQSPAWLLLREKGLLLI
ncbi:B12-binding domain-containing radical SAM protein [Hymenobacter sp. BT770]|uniref:B12-binding domain-containing radical SAM protein n=1 Tax=Hymenobacter sp. BT770 TaxID=2886942 RepID=UPI001D117822|nr:B12-binding domain-containing radical SAM protein [Hymenobacter sp. BT770]MCC3155143.1 radical SAM protein [Hymenobacter sp. BT770]MDO3417134.1 B12-binding domain-containing radical SAM protein [Hymenobacter sp. BT770]